MTKRGPATPFIPRARQRPAIPLLQIQDLIHTGIKIHKDIKARSSPIAAKWENLVPIQLKMDRVSLP